MKPFCLRQWLVILSVLFSFFVQAQPHYNSFFRATVNVPVNKKVKIDTEFQHRRQNGYSTVNPLGKNLMFSARGWVHYQAVPNVRFSFSPFAYFLHNKIILHKADEQVAVGNEIRFSVSAETQHRISGKLNAVYRPGGEYRLLENYDIPVLRIRNRLGLRYRINPKSNIFIYDELFINGAGVNRRHLFDHNRIVAGIEHTMNSKIKLEMGYMYIDRLPLQNTIRLYENIFFVNFTYTISNYL